MGVCNAGFELGRNGATISAADQGDGDAWDLVTVGAGDATAIYDATHVALGAQAAKIATVTAASVVLRWDTKFGTLTDHFGRAYLYLTANPAAILSLLGANSDTTLAYRIRITTAGKVQLIDAGSTQRALGSVSIVLNQWIRIEYHVTHSTTAGFIEAKLFNTATSAVADETITSTGSFSTLASANRVQHGVLTSTANVAAFWMDQIQAGASAYAGPAAVGKASALLLGVGA